MITVKTEYINETNEEPEITPKFKTLAGKVIKKALELEGFDKDCKVSVSLVSEEEMKSLNKETRNINRVTDVLSFPNLEFETPGDFSVINNGDFYYDIFDPETGLVFLGDIVICLNRAKQQADEYGHSLKRELAFLTAHSILHLCGYDHMEDDERLVMEEKQRNILDELNIKR